MHTLRTAGFCIAFALATVGAAHADIVYVNAAQTIPFEQQDGTSWATAYKFLEDGLNFSPDGSEIWAATGTYVPSAFGDRSLSFVVGTGKILRGGFLPGATSVDDRDPVAHPTILSGEIGNPNITSDNSRRVVRLVGPGPRLDGVIVERGTADGLDGGAGIFGTSAPGFVIENCVVRDCTAANRGAGAQIVNSSGIVRGCTFSNNVAISGGGGCDVQGSSVSFVGCRFVGNKGGSGGGLFFQGGLSGSVVNCVFSGNKATNGSGGGLVVSGGPYTLSCSTFSHNTGSLNGGAVQIASPVAGTQVTNCLFADNTAPNFPQISIASGPSPTIQHNGFTSSPSAGTGNVVVNPHFVDADGADNVFGTPDDDLHLSAASEAIDHGCGTLLPNDSADLDGDGNTSEPLSRDIDGVLRLVDEFIPDTGLGALPFLDFGAHESDAPYAVVHVNANVRGGNADGTSWANAFKRLSDGLDFAMSGAITKPVEIWVAQGTYFPTEDSDRSISFQPEGSLKLYGGFEGGETSRSERLPFKRPTILSGNIGSSGASDNSYHVLRFVGDNVYPETVVDGFVITDGVANGLGLDSVGGGMLVRLVARPTIRNCRFLGNQAVVGGGGVCSLDSGSGPALFNCYFAENGADRGGALYAADGASEVEVVNCTIASNHAGACGGIFAADNGTFVAVLNTLFTLNTHGDADDATAHLLAVSSGTIKIGYSALPCSEGISGEGMIALPPALNDLDGDDNQFGTVDDLLILQPGSPCIDAGARSNGAVDIPFDAFDVDDDGDLNEFVPIDAAGSPRFVDAPNMPDADPGFPIDIGAVENEESLSGPGPVGDFNEDGHINGADLATLLGFWGVNSPGTDLNGDCIINGADLAVLLGGWTG